MLDDMDINYVSEQSFHPYTVDIYLPEWHLALEIDGPFHVAQCDRHRDKYLWNYYGLPIIRFNIVNHLIKREELERKVTEFIEKHEPTVKVRKALWRLSVDSVR